MVLEGVIAAVAEGGEAAAREVEERRRNRRCARAPAVLRSGYGLRREMTMCNR